MSTDKLLTCVSFKPDAYPAVPGLEGVGTVMKNGSGASKLKARFRWRAYASAKNRFSSLMCESD